jgi:protein-S-isoprenylcysteine O-methyltransferase Ste14
MISGLQALGVAVAFLALVLIGWSILVPTARLWPPRTPSRLSTVLVWATTAVLAGVILLLCILGWGQGDLPGWLRFGVGLPLLATGNYVVWHEARRFGARQTMGGVGSLKTDGFYRYSRHPQYVADIGLCMGWVLLSASLAALPVIVAALAVLILAPFAEEPWLEERFGDAYRAYRHEVRRFL